LPREAFADLEARPCDARPVADPSPPTHGPHRYWQAPARDATPPIADRDFPSMLEEAQPLTDLEIARVASRGAVSYIARTGLSLVLQTIGSLLIARYLDPRNYGLFGLGLTLTGGLRYIGDLGVTFRLAVAKEASREDFRRGLAVGLIIALAGALLLSGIWQLLPPVASASTSIRLLGPAFGLYLLVTVPMSTLAAMLERQLAFRTVGTIGVASALAASACLISLLLIGLGIWALILSQLIGSAIGLALGIRAVGGFPRPTLRGPVIALIRESFPYQGPQIAQGVVGTAFPVIVVSILGTRDLGFVAWSTILATPFLSLIYALSPVIAPSLARMLREDGSRYGDASMTVLLTLAVLSAAGAGAVIGLVPSIVRFVFGARWLPARDAVELCLLGILPTSLVVGCSSIIGSRNQPGKTVRASLAGGAAAVLVTVPASLLAGVTGAAAAAYVGAPLIELAVLARLGRLPLRAISLRGARLLIPLAAASFEVGRRIDSPAGLAEGAAVMAAGTVLLLGLFERELIRSLWRRVRPDRARSPWEPDATLRARVSIHRLSALLAAELALSAAAVALVTRLHISTTTALLIPVVAFAALWLFFNPRPEVSLALLLIYLGVFDGFLKLKTGSSTITVARDVFLWLIALGMLARKVIRREGLFFPRHTALVLLFVAIVLMQTLNPSSAGLRADVGGFRQHLEFVPLFFMAPNVLGSASRLRAFFALLLFAAFVNGIVGVIQFNLSPGQLASWGPGFAQLINGTGAFAGAGRVFASATGQAHPRPPALGSDEGFGGLLGALAIPGGLVLLNQVRALRGRLLVIIGLLGAVAGVVTSQARLAVAVAVAAALAYALLTASTPGRRRQVWTLGVALVVVYAFVALFVSANSTSGIFSRYADISASAFSQSRGSSLAVVPQYILDYPFGNGIGRSGPAAGFGGSASGLNAENEFNLLIIEVGVPGLLVILLLWLKTLGDGVRTAFLRRDDYGGCIAAMVAGLAGGTIAWVAATTTVNTPLSPYFWLAAGVVGTAYGRARRASRTTGGQRAVIDQSAALAERAVRPSRVHTAR
jgi:O-antigen/teichoic acid export membrane protein